MEGPGTEETVQVGDPETRAGSPLGVTSLDSFPVSRRGVSHLWGDGTLDGCFPGAQPQFPLCEGWLA